MSSTTSSSNTTGQNIGTGIKSAVQGVHGLGEAIRGNVNEAVDSAFGDKHGEVKNENVVKKGAQEIAQAEKTFGKH